MNALSGVMKTIFSHGLATAETVVDSLRDSSIALVEHLNAEPNELYNAKWGDPSEIISPNGKGIAITGRGMFLYPEANYKSTIVLGSSGSGKTSIVNVNTLMNANGSSYIVHCPSGQTINLCAPDLLRKKYRVLVWDLENLNSCSINLLDFVTDATSAGKIASQLILPTLGTASDPFWSLSSIQIIRMLMMLVKKLDCKYQNMANVRHLLLAFSGSRDAVSNLFVKHATNEEFLEYKAVLKSNEKTLASTLSTCQAALEVFNAPNVRRLTSRTTIEGGFESFRTIPTVLFIKNAVADGMFYQPVINSIVKSAIKVFMSHLPVSGDLPIYFMLDECATLKLEDDSLNETLSNCRKHRLAFCLLFQSQFQVLALGKEAGKNILANCHNKLYLRGADLDTCQELEQVLGKRTIRDAKGREKLVPLLPAQKIRQIRRDQAILLYGSNAPYLVDVMPYYKQNLIFQNRIGKGVFHLLPSEIPSHIELIPLL